MRISKEIKNTVMVNGHVIHKRYKKEVIQTKRYAAHDSTVIVEPSSLARLLAPHKVGISGIVLYLKNIKVLFTAYSLVVGKCLWILINLYYKVFPKP